MPPWVVNWVGVPHYFPSPEAISILSLPCLNQEDSASRSSRYKNVSDAYFSFLLAKAVFIMPPPQHHTQPGAVAGLFCSLYLPDSVPSGKHGYLEISLDGKC